MSQENSNETASSKSASGVEPSQVIVVALTGGIASGKSTVGRLMSEMGCTVTDADALVAQLYLPGSPGSELVRQLFGDEMLNPAGAVDKAALAKRVFADTEARKQLEQAIHPLVGQAFGELVRNSQGIVVFEVPLLAESGRKPNYPFVITVEADDDLRIARAVERGMDRADVEARLAAQATRAEREAVATHVIENHGSLEDLERQVRAIVAELEAAIASG